MKVIFKDGTALTVTEILGTRVTGKDASGKYLDRQLKDVTSFNGRVVFYDTPADDANAVQYVNGSQEQPTAPSLPTPDYFLEDAADEQPAASKPAKVAKA